MKSLFFKSPLPYLALIAAHVIWGANFVVSKVALQEFPVMSLAFLRFFLASLLFLPLIFSLKKTERKIEIKHLPFLFGAGIFMVTLNIAFFYEGLVRTTAIDASVLALSAPFISVLLGWWFLKEKVYFINLVGIMVGFLGAIIIIGLPLILANNITPTILIGNSMILLASFCTVTGALLVKEIVKKYSPTLITMFVFVTGAVTFLIPALLDLVNNPTWYQGVTILGITGLLYNAIFSSITAYFLLNWALKKVELSQANLFNFLMPAIAATLAVPFLGERISFSFIIGTVLVVLGVYWGTLGKQEHHHTHHKHHRI